MTNEQIKQLAEEKLAEQHISVLGGVQKQKIIRAMCELYTSAIQSNSTVGKAKAIIITQTWNEANKLNLLLSKSPGGWEGNFQGPYAGNKDTYNAKWFWTWDGEALGGSSGYLAYEAALKRFPLYPTYTLKGYLSLSSNSTGPR